MRFSSLFAGVGVVCLGLGACTADGSLKFDPEGDWSLTWECTDGEAGTSVLTFYTYDGEYAVYDSDGNYAEVEIVDHNTVRYLSYGGNYIEEAELDMLSAHELTKVSEVWFTEYGVSYEASPDGDPDTTCTGTATKVA